MSFYREYLIMITAICMHRTTTGVPTAVQSPQPAAERRLSMAAVATSALFGIAGHPVKQHFGELRRAKTERSERKKARLMEENNNNNNNMDNGKVDLEAEQLPDWLWRRVNAQLGPVDRLRLAGSCRRLRQLLGHWEDVQALDIRPEWAIGDSPSACPSPPLASPSSTAHGGAAALLGGLPSLVRPRHHQNKRQPRGFRLQLQFASGRVGRMRTSAALVAANNGEPEVAERLLKQLFARMAGSQIAELTVWEACLGDRFRTCLLRCCPALRCLRLWNCGRWLDSTSRPPPILLALLGLPQLRQLLVLDSQPLEPDAGCRWLFSKQLARAIAGNLQELQLTNCRLPLRALELLQLKCGHSLRRLAIGCTFGKEQKRLQYLRLLRQFPALTDLDLPPFLFHLRDQPQPDLLTQRLLQALPQLRALGFRHFNSSALFRFIESQLPRHIRVLRVHHNAHRVPNFAELGLGHAPTGPPPRSASLLLPESPDSQRHSSHRQQQEQQQKKHSIVSRCSLLSSSDSLGFFQSTSASSPARQQQQQQPSRSATFCAASQPFAISSTGMQHSPSCSSSACSSISSWPSSSGRRPSSNNARTKSFSLGPEDGLSMATASTWCTLSTAEDQPAATVGDGMEAERGGQQRQLLEELSRRRLTIFAIAEERQSGCSGGGQGRRMRGRQQRLRKASFSGVEVIYVSPPEAQASQEVLGRMARPIQSPYVYTTGQGQQPGGRGMRVIRGDLVRAIPLSSLGMESDWESDEES